jgi:hypothetical protein
MHDQGIFPWSLQLFPFCASKIQLSLIITNMLLYLKCAYFSSNQHVLRRYFYEQGSRRNGLHRI